MRKLKFSVIVPVLNGKTHLEQCFGSILQQAPRPELIVVDGGSSDGSLDIIDRHSRYISYQESGKDTGIANAFNRGLLHANGDIIAILNSDDFWEPEAIQIILEEATQHPEADIFIAQCRLLPTDGAPYIKKPNLRAMKRYMSTYHPSTFIKRKAYKEIGVYNENYRLAMDSEWIHRAMNAKATFHEVHTVTTNMRMGGISDALASNALREYRQSIVQHHIANPSYAHLFYWLHRASKTLDHYRYLGAIKRQVNKLINPTADYRKNPSKNDNVL